MWRFKQEIPNFEVRLRLKDSFLERGLDRCSNIYFALFFFLLHIFNCALGLSFIM